MVVDFSGLTDLINATMTILGTFNSNSSTLYGFFVLMGGLTLVGVIIGFIYLLLHRVGEKMGGAGGKKY
jgi:hypothetical protein